MHKLSVFLIVTAVALSLFIPLFFKANTVFGKTNIIPATSPVKIKNNPVTPPNNKTPKPSAAPATPPVKR